MAVDRRTFGIGLLAGATALPAKAQALAWTTPDEATIRQILAQRIDVQKAGVGIVVAIVDAKGRRYVSHGVRDGGRPGPLDARTIFEIGSMTKVFTSLLLEIAVMKGEVALDDPLEKYLPAGVRVPQRGGRQITLIDLATHSSGLPSLPTNFAPKDPANPYADYTPEMLWAFLAGYQLPRDIGSQYQYSNMGAALLGQALSHRAALPYDELVRRRITGPLGMASTTIDLTPAQAARLAPGHDASLQRVPGWDLPTFAGAGALHSDAEDIATFLSAELGFTPSPLKAAMAAQLVPRRPGPAPNVQVALAWHITRTRASQELVWHNGGTGGYRSFMGFDPAAKVGVVVLTNTANEVGGDDIGFHLLAGAPLQTPTPAPKVRTAIRLPVSELDGLVGAYAINTQLFLTITREGDQLYAQIPGQAKYPVFTETRDDVFWKVVDAQASFQRGPDGRAIGLTFRQGGREAKAAWIAP
jgi:CubicO group peptidase (beta-lactamase class C family)